MVLSSLLGQVANLGRGLRYAHMNNSIYNFLYDSVVNTYLIQHCGLRPVDGDQYGMIGKPVQSH